MNHRSLRIRSLLVGSVLGGSLLAGSLLGGSLLGGCGGGSENLPPPPPPSGETTPVPAATTAPAATATTAAPAAEKPTLPPVALEPGTASPDPTPAPTVRITAPTKGQILKKDKAGDFAVKLDVKSWPTAPGSSHVHLILDNKPYKAIYDTKAPVKLSELTGGEPLAEGQHVLVAFPSRANHESVKTPNAVSVVEFYVDKKADGVDLKKPMLVYSRPKGDYKGETANHVLVDFYLVNTTLGEGKNSVAVEVTGPGIDKPLQAKAEKFGPPFYLENLRNGAYTVKLDLLGADGKAVGGPWNSTTREIKIDRDAPADPTPHAGHDAAAGAPADAKATGAKPGDAKAGDTKGGDTKAGEAKPGKADKAGDTKKK